MCGIAGFCLNPSEHGVNRADLAAGLLAEIESRGRDATGAAWVDPKSKRLNNIKHATPADKYVRGAGDRLCHGAMTAVMHTRYATQGNPRNNANNHPVQRGHVVLTHNGHIGNDAALFRELEVERKAQVDTEAAAALLAFGVGKHPTELLQRLRGTAALAWIRTGDPYTLHLARVTSSPLWLAQTTGGSLVYASTQDAVLNGVLSAGLDYDWLHCASEGEYFKVRHGSIVEHRKFTPRREMGYLDWRAMRWADDDKEHAAITSLLSDEWLAE